MRSSISIKSRKSRIPGKNVKTPKVTHVRERKDFCNQGTHMRHQTDKHYTHLNPCVLFPSTLNISFSLLLSSGSLILLYTHLIYCISISIHFVFVIITPLMMLHESRSFISFCFSCVFISSLIFSSSLSTVPLFPGSGSEKLVTRILDKDRQTDREG